MTTKTAKPRLAPVVLIFPAGTAIRAKSRKSGEFERQTLDKMLKLTGAQVSNVYKTDRTQTTIVQFSYKGRPATAKLKKAVRGAE